MGQIKVQNLSFAYVEHVDVLHDISFEIADGEYVCILGHNGSGKSTIAKLLCGLLEKGKGEIYINGLPLDEKHLYEVRSHIGIVFQNPDNQFIGATVRDDIAFGLENRCVDPKEMDDLINQNAKEVDMLEFLDHEPSFLSGGQKQRVAIAGILAMRPDILILDEATSMLDPKGRTEINNLVHKIRAEKAMTVVAITHDISEALNADRVMILQEGRVAAFGKPAAVLSDEKFLNKVGLLPPFPLALSLELRKRGVRIPKTIDEKELVNSLCRLHSRA